MDDRLDIGRRRSRTGVRGVGSGPSRGAKGDGLGNGSDVIRRRRDGRCGGRGSRCGRRGRGRHGRGRRGRGLVGRVLGVGEEGVKGVALTRGVDLWTKDECQVVT